MLREIQLCCCHTSCISPALAGEFVAFLVLEPEYEHESANELSPACALPRQALSMVAFLLCFLLPIFMHPGISAAFSGCLLHWLFRLGCFLLKIGLLSVCFCHARQACHMHTDHASPAPLPLSSLCSYYAFFLLFMQSSHLAFTSKTAPASLSSA